MGFGTRPPRGVPALKPPTNITAEVSGSDIVISWTAAKSVDGYHVYQQIDGGTWTKLNATATTDLTYTLTPTEPGEYNFLVTSVRGSAESAPSAETLLDDVFYFAVNSTQTISGLFSTTGEITVHWGDGTSNTYNGTDQAWSKDYGSAVDELVVIEGSDYITKFTMDQSGADISFDLGHLPINLTNFICYGSNTVSGSLADLPSGLTYFNCQGSNTVSGSLADLPSGLTSFLCQGSNTISGSLADLPSGLTSFLCYGLNTVSGSLADLPDGLTYFNCYGSNTVSGSLADLPSGLTYFICSGSNTVSGSLADLPSGLTYFICYGLNTIDTYTTRTWTTKPSMFTLVPVSPGGLSETEINQLLVDLDEDLEWTSGTITLTGTNAAPTGVGLTAANNMDAEGATVTVNS
jgi:hypothetical protein